MLQADFRVVETYCPGGEGCSHGAPRLACPVVALGASEDGRYSRQQLGAWREVAPKGAGGFVEVWFPGGHRCAALPRSRGAGILNRLPARLLRYWAAGLAGQCCLLLLSG